MPLGLLARLPKEVETAILKLTGDWKTALTVEAISSGLLNRFDDVDKALKSVQGSATLTVSIELIKNDPQPNLLHLGPVHVAFLIWCRQNNTIKPQLLVDRTFELWETVHPFFEMDPNLKSLPALLAALNPTVKILRYIRQRAAKALSVHDVVNAAALNGDFDSIRFLHASKSKGFHYAGTAAAAAGNLEMVKWVCENWKDGFDAFPMNVCDGKDSYGRVEALDHAANKGHLDVVKYLCEHRKDMAVTASTMSNAA
ncbi:hypothetical protein HDU97_009298, partial [Phlyctochytrium planicorne]